VHKARNKTFVFLCGCYMCNCWVDKNDTGLCESYDQYAWIAN